MATAEDGRGEAPTGGAATKLKLKMAAQRLFARHGFDGVTVQQIVSAAGQRNNASLHYHFGSKEELARQLIVDGARLIDARRQAMLDEIEARERGGGPPPTLREVMYALVLPVAGIGEAPEQRTYMRFIANIQLSRRKLLREAVGNRWNTGYRRCLDLLRRLNPGIPAPLLEQRLSLSGIYGNAILAAREEFVETRSGGPNRFWDHDHTLENIVDTLLATIAAPPSAETLAALQDDAGGRRKPRRARRPSGG